MPCVSAATNAVALPATPDPITNNLSVLSSCLVVVVVVENDDVVDDNVVRNLLAECDNTTLYDTLDRIMLLLL